MKVILADDEPAILDELKDMLDESKGIDVIGVYTEPFKALAEANEKMPDCAFLDIEMMGMSGIELAEKLMLINPDIQVVFVTAYNHYAAQAFDA